MASYKTTIGLEIHAELNTKSKLFCGCDNDSPPGTTPNINTCEICTGHPGVLPVLNKEAVKAILKLGLALEMEIPQVTKWDRKHYFYPDLPKGYQISQYDIPITAGGELILSGGKKIRITRAHLEEDSGKLTHSGRNTTLVDLNRAGTPLIELVTEPDFESAAETKEFAREYQTILRYLGVSNANMEKGEMRVEANISVSKKSELGTKVEVKNLNSFKALERAIEFEVKRQSELIDEGGEVVQETRGWNDAKQKTFPQRVKETAADYRYFPEPDIPELEIEKSWLIEIKKTMPDLPKDIRQKLKTSGVTDEDSAVISGDITLLNFYNLALEHGPNPKTTASALVNELLGKLNEMNKGIEKVDPMEFGRLVTIWNKKEITGPIFKSALLAHIQTGDKIEKIVAGADMGKITDDQLGIAIKLVIENNPKPVADFKNGKEEVLKFLIGQVMKETKGQADPESVANELKKQLLL